MCLQGASRVVAATEDLGDLRTLIVWIPMLPPDSEAAALDAARSFPTARHFWDGDRRLAKEIGRTLGVTAKESLGVDGDLGLAWDVYLAYGRGKNLGDEPDFWMHQLAVKHAPRLDPDAFRRRVERLLRP
jgi:hypothetical protein